MISVPELYQLRQLAAFAEYGTLSEAAAKYPDFTALRSVASGYFASGLDKRQYSIYTEKGKRVTDQPLSAQSHFSAVDCFYRVFFAEPILLMHT